MSFFNLFRQKESSTTDSESDIRPTPAQLAKAQIIADEKYEAACKFVDRHYKPSLSELLSGSTQYKPSGRYDNASCTNTSAGSYSAKEEPPASESKEAPASESKESSASESKESHATEAAGSQSSQTDNGARYSISDSSYEYCDDLLADESFSAVGFMEQLYSLDAKKDSAIINSMLSMSFSTCTRKLMEEKGLTAAEVYKKAQIDKSTFSKILSLPSYSPTKDTAIAVCLGLTLNLRETKTLLTKAGYTLSSGILRDVLVRFCIETQLYDVVMVNCLLEKFGCRPLGRS